MNITKDFPEQLKTKLSRETKQYFETGNCDSSKKIRSALFNPTLLEPGTLRWRVDPYSCPFDSYLPLQLDQLEVSAEEGIITRYCKKKLKKLVSVYTENRNNFNLNFHLKDALQFCIEETTEKFDVIDCSTLADEVGMANLILSSKNVLELHSEAVLLTESQQWRKLASTVALYLEDCLCAPLSMIPTIYGLRLAYPVELGSPTLLQVDRIIGYEFPSVTLTWHRTLRSENLPVSYSPVLERCLKKLEEKCFFMDCGSDWLVEKRGPVSYTPLTFDFVATGLAKYVATHGHLPQMKPFELYPLPRFSLARKTLEDWRNRQSVVLLTASEQFSPLLFSKKFIYGSPLLRMVLVPNNASLIHFAALFASENLTDDLPINWADRMPDVHYIDNFHLHYEKDHIGSSHSLKVSFLLPRKHELGTHCGIIIDMISGIPLIFLGSLEDMHQETFDRLFPIKIRTSSLSEVFPQSPTLHVVNCKEDETSFTVQINIGTEFFKGMKSVIIYLRSTFSQYIETTLLGIRISTDKQFPCEAGHKVTLTLDQPEGTEPLTLHFPHPILSEEINGALHRSEHSIQVMVKKGLNEPWPCQFVETPKWNVAQFSPWSELSASPSAPIESQLLIHCIAQQGNNPFNAAWRDILDPSKCAKLLPIQVVRNLIGNSLYYAGEGHQIFVVNNIQDPLKPLWHFLVHRPILVSPSNTPLLLISAVDHRLSHKLISKGKLEARRAQEDFQRIVGHKVTANVKPIELNATEEASQLLRFVLRLNSTRMIPTSWQGENLPLGKYSSYLATFLSPLYLDYPYPDMGRECVQSLKNWQRMYYRVRTIVSNVNRDRRPS